MSNLDVLDSTDVFRCFRQIKLNLDMIEREIRQYLDRI
jgi:hypothetical protein